MAVMLLFAQMAGRMLPAQMPAPIVARAVPIVMVPFAVSGARRMPIPVMMVVALLDDIDRRGRGTGWMETSRAVMQVQVYREAGAQFLRLGRRRARHYP